MSLNFPLLRRTISFHSISKQLRERISSLLEAITTVGIVALRIQKVSSMHRASLGEHTYVEIRRCGNSFIIIFSLHHLVSRGPTSDGRQKPDVLAPGHFILSAGALPKEVGECDPVLGTVEPGDSGGGLLSMEGTSMAAPALAGAAAIVRQYFNDGFYPSGERNDADKIENPSAALIKGVIMNGAQYVDGVQNKIIGITPVTPYDETQNFGRISLKDSLYIAGKTNTRLSIFDREAIGDEETKTYRFVIDRSNGCTNPNFSITLIWNEPGVSVLNQC